MGADRVLALFTILFWFLSIVEAYDPFHYDPNDPCFRRCTRYYAPVCGSDGETYYSICVLFSIKCHRKDPDLAVAYQGRCRTRHPAVLPEEDCPRECPDIVSPVCGSDGRTYDNPCLLGAMACETKTPSLVKINDGYCDQEGLGGRCPLEYKGKYKPVCGRDGKTYVNQGILQITACVQNDPNLASQAHKGECEFKGRRKRRKCRKPACDMNYDPVCGTDGKTYFNKCFMDYFACRRDMDTMRLLYLGVCRQEVVVLLTRPTRGPTLTTPDGGRVTNLLPGPLSKSTPKTRIEAETQAPELITIPTTATPSTTATTTRADITPSTVHTAMETTPTTSTPPALQTTPTTAIQSSPTSSVETSPTTEREETTSIASTPSTKRPASTTLIEEKTFTTPITETSPTTMQASSTSMIDGTTAVTEKEETSLTTSTPSATQSTPTTLIEDATSPTEVDETAPTASTPSATQSTPTTLIEDATSPTEVDETAPTTSTPSATQSTPTTLIEDATSPTEVDETTPTTSTASAAQSTPTTQVTEEETAPATSTPPAIQSTPTTLIEDATSPTEVDETTRPTSTPSATHFTPTTQVTEEETAPATSTPSATQSTPTTLTEDATSPIEVDESTATTSTPSAIQSTPTTMTEDMTSATEYITLLEDKTSPTELDETTPTTSTPAAPQSTPTIQVTEEEPSPATSTPSAIQSTPTTLAEDATSPIDVDETTPTTSTSSATTSTPPPPFIENTTSVKEVEKTTPTKSTPTEIQTTPTTFTEGRTSQPQTTLFTIEPTISVTPMSPTNLKVETEEPGSFSTTTSPTPQTDLGKNATEQPLLETTMDGSGMSSSPTIEVLSTTSTFSTVEKETDLSSTYNPVNVTKSPGLDVTTAKPPGLIVVNQTAGTTPTEKMVTDYSTEIVKDTEQPTVETTLFGLTTDEGSGTVTPSSGTTPLYTESDTGVTPTSSKHRDTYVTTEEPSFLSTSLVVEATSQESNATEKPMFETTTEGSGLPSSPMTETTSVMDMTTPKSPELIQQNETRADPETTATASSTDVIIGTRQPTVEITLPGSTTEGSGEVTTLDGQTTMFSIESTTAITPMSPTDLTEETEEPNFLSTTSSPIPRTGLGQNATEQPLLETTMDGSGRSSSPTIEVLSTTSTFSTVEKETDLSSTDTPVIVTKSPSMDVTTAKFPGSIVLNETTDTTPTEKMVTDYSPDLTKGTEQTTEETTLFGSTSEGSGTMIAIDVTTEEPSFLSTSLIDETMGPETNATEKPIFETTREGSGLSSTPPIEMLSTTSTSTSIKDTTTALPTIEIMSVQTTILTGELSSTTTIQDETTSPGIDMTTAKSPEQILQNETSTDPVATATASSTDVITDTRQPTEEVTLPGSTTEGSGEVTTVYGQTTLFAIESTTAITPMSPTDVPEETEEPSFLSTTTSPTPQTDLGRNATEQPLLETTMVGSGMSSSPTIEVLSTTSSFSTLEKETDLSSTDTPVNVTKSPRMDVTTARFPGSIVLNETTDTTPTEKIVTDYSPDLTKGTEQPTEETTLFGLTTEGSGTMIDTNVTTEEPSLLSTSLIDETMGPETNATEKPMFDTTTEGSGLSSSPPIEILSTTSPGIDMTTAKSPEQILQNETSTDPVATATASSTDFITGTRQPTGEVTLPGSTTEGSGEVTTLYGQTTSFSIESTTAVTPMSQKETDLTEETTEEPSFLSTISSPTPHTDLGRNATEQPLLETTMDGSGMSSSPTIEVLSATSTLSTIEKETALSSTAMPEDVTKSPRMDVTTARFPGSILLNETTDDTPTEKMVTDYSPDLTKGTEQTTEETTLFGSTTEGSGTMIAIDVTTEEPSLLSTSLIDETMGPKTNATEKPMFETTTEGSGLSSSPPIEILSTTSTSTREEKTVLPTIEIMSVQTTILSGELSSTTTIQNETTSSGMDMTSAKSPEQILQNETRADPETTATASSTDFITDTRQPTEEVTLPGSTTEGSGEVTTLYGQTTLFSIESTTAVTPMSPTDVTEETEEPSFLTITTSPISRSGLGQNATEQPLFETTLDGSGMSSSATIDVLSTTSTLSTKEKETDLLSTAMPEDVTNSPRMDVTTARLPGSIVLNETTDDSPTEKMFTDYSPDLTKGTEQTTEETTLFGSTTEGSGTMIAIDVTTKEPSFLSTSLIDETMGPETNVTEKPMFETTTEGSGLSSSPPIEMLSTSSTSTSTKDEKTALPTIEIMSVQTTITTGELSSTTTIQDETTSPGMDMTTAKSPEQILQNETRAYPEATATASSTDFITDTRQPTVEVTFPGSTTEGSGEVTTLDGKTTSFTVDYTTAVTSISPIEIDVKEETEEPSFLSTTTSPTHRTGLDRNATEQPLLETTLDGSGIISSSPTIELLSSKSKFSTVEEATDFPSTTMPEDVTKSPRLETTTAKFPGIIVLNETTDTTPTEKMVTQYSAAISTGTMQPTVEVTSPGSTTEGSGELTTLEGRTGSYAEGSTTAVTPMSSTKLDLKEETQEPSFLRTSTLPTARTGLRQNTTEEPLFETTFDGSGMSSSETTEVPSTTLFPNKETTDLPLTTKVEDVTKLAAVDVTTARPPGLIVLNETSGTPPTDKMGTDFFTDITTEHPTVEVTLYGSTSEGSGTITPSSGTTTSYTDLDSGVTSTPSKSIDTKVTTEEPSFLSTSLIVETTGPKTNGTEKPTFEAGTEGSGLLYSQTTEMLSSTSKLTTEGESSPSPTIEITSFETTIRTTEFPSTTTLQDETTPPGMGITTAKSPELIQHNETKAATEATTTGSYTYVITSTMQPMVEVTSTTEGSGEMTTLEERTGLYSEGSTTAVTPMSSTKLDLKEETQEPSFLRTSTSPTAQTGSGQNATEEPLSETTFDGSGMSSSQTTEVLSTTLFPNEEATDLPLTTKVEDVTKLTVMDVTTAKSPGLLVFNETTGTPPTDKMGTDYSTDITTEHPTVEVTLYGSTSEGSGTKTPSSGTTTLYTDLDSGVTSMPSKSTDTKVTTEEPSFLSTSVIIETTSPETNGTEKPTLEGETEGSGLLYSPTTEMLSSTSKFTTEGESSPSPTIEITSFETTIRTTEFPSTTTLQDETTPPGMGMTTAKSPELIQHNETKAATEATTTGSYTYVITSTMQPMVEVTSTTEGSGEMTTLEERTGLYSEGSTTAVTPMSSTKLDLKEETQEPSFLRTSTSPTAQTGLGQNATEEPLSETTFDGSGMSSSQTTEVLSTTLFPNEEATDLPLTTKVEDVTKLTVMDVTTAKSPGLLVLNETTGTPPTDKMGTDYSTDITTGHPTVEVTLYGSTSEGSGTKTPSSGMTTLYTDLDSGVTYMPSKSTDTKVTTEEPDFLSTSVIVEITDPETNATVRPIFGTTTEGSGLSSPTTESLSSTSRFTTKEGTTLQTNKITSVTGYSTEQTAETKVLVTDVTSFGTASEGSGTVTTSSGVTTADNQESVTAVTPSSPKQTESKKTTEEPSYLRTTVIGETTGPDNTATEEELFQTTMEGSGMASSPTIEILSTTITIEEGSTISPSTTILEDVTKPPVDDVATARPPGLIKLNDTTSTASIEKMVTGYSTEETAETKVLVTDVTSFGTASEGSGTVTTSSGVTTADNQQSVTAVTPSSPKQTESKKTTEEPSYLRTTVIGETTGPDNTATEEELFQTTMEGSGMASSPTIEILSTTITIEEGSTISPSTTILEDLTKSPVDDVATARPPGLIKLNDTTSTASIEKMVTGYSTEQTAETKVLVTDVTSFGTASEGSGTVTTSSGVTTVDNQESVTAVTPSSPKQTESKKTTEEPSYLQTTVIGETTGPDNTATEKELFQTTMEGSGMAPSPTVEILSTTISIEEEATFFMSTTIGQDISKSPMEDVATPRSPGLIKLNETTVTGETDRLVTDYSTDQTGGTTPSQSSVNPTSSKQIDLKEATEEPSYITVSTEMRDSEQTATQELLFETTMEGSGMSSSPTIDNLSTTITIEEGSTISPSTTILEDVTKPPVDDVATARPPGLIKLNDTTSTASIEKMVTGYSTEQTAETKVLVTDVTSFGTASEGSGTVTTSSGVTTADNQQSVTAVTPSSPKQTESKKTTEEPSYLRTTVIGETTGPDNTATEEELFQTTMEGSGMASSPTSEILSSTITIEEGSTISPSTTILEDVTKPPVDDVATARPPGLIKLNDTTSTASIEKMVTGYSTEQTVETKVLVTDVTSFGTASEGSGTVTSSSGVTTVDNQESVTAVTPSSPKQTESKKTTEEPSYLRTTVIGETTGPDNTATEEELFQTTMEGSGMAPSPTVEILSTTISIEEEATFFMSTTIGQDISKSPMEDVATPRSPGLIKLNETTVTGETDRLVTDYSTDQTGGTTPSQSSVTPTSSKQIDLKEATEEPSYITVSTEMTDSEQTATQELLFETTMEGSGISSSPTIDNLSTTITIEEGSTISPSTTILEDVTKPPVDDVATARPPGLIKLNDTTSTASIEKMVTGYSTEQTAETKVLVTDVTSFGIASEGSGTVTTSSGVTTVDKQESVTAVTPSSPKQTESKKTTEEPSYLRTTVIGETTGPDNTATEEELFQTTMEGSGMTPSPTIEILSTTITIEEEATMSMSTIGKDISKSPMKDVATPTAPGLIKLNETTVTGETDKVVTDSSTDQTGGTPPSQTSVTPTSSKQIDLKEATEEPSYITVSTEMRDSEQTATQELLFETTMEGSGMSSSPTIDSLSTTFTIEKESTPTPAGYTTYGITSSIPMEVHTTPSAIPTAEESTISPSTTIDEDISKSPMEDVATPRAPGLIKLNDTTSTASIEKMVTGYSTEQTAETKVLVTDVTSFGMASEGSGTVTTSSGVTTVDKQESVTAVTPSSPKQTESKKTTEQPSYLRTTVIGETTGPDNTATEEELFQTTMEGSGMAPSPTIEILSTTITIEEEATVSMSTTIGKDISKSPMEDVATPRAPGLIKLNDTTSTASIEKMVTGYSTEQTVETKVLVTDVTSFGMVSEGSGTVTTSSGVTTVDKQESVTAVTPSSPKQTESKKTTEQPSYLRTTVIGETTGQDNTATEEELFQTTMEGSGMAPSPTVEILSTTISIEEEATMSMSTIGKDISKSPMEDVATPRAPGLIKLNETTVTGETDKVVTDSSTDQTGGTPLSQTSVTPTSSKQIDLKEATEEPSYITVSTEMRDSEQTATQELLFETTMEGSGMSSSPTIDNLSTTFTIEKESTPTTAGYTTYEITSSIPMEVHTTPSAITTAEGSTISPSTTIDEDISKSPMEDVATPRAPGLIKLNDTTSTVSIEKMVTGYSTEQTAETKVLVTDVTSFGTASEGSGTVTTSSGVTTVDKQESVTAVTPSSPKQTESKKTTAEEPSYLRTTVIGETTGPDNTATEEELFQTTMEGSGMAPSPTVEILSTTISIEEEATMSMSTIGKDISKSPMEDVATPRAPGLIKLNDTTSTASIEKMVTGYSTEETAETKVLVTDVTSFGTASEGSGTVTTSSGVTTADKQESVTAVTPSSPKQTESKKTTEEPSYTTLSTEMRDSEQTATQDLLFETTMEGSGMSPSPTIEILSTTIIIEEGATISMSSTIGEDISKSPMKDVATPRAPGLIKLNETTVTGETDKMVTDYSTDQTGGTPPSQTSVNPTSSKQIDLKEATEEPSYITVSTEMRDSEQTATQELLFETTMEGSGMAPSPTIDILSTTITIEEEAMMSMSTTIGKDISKSPMEDVATPRAPGLIKLNETTVTGETEKLVTDSSTDQTEGASSTEALTTAIFVSNTDKARTHSPGMAITILTEHEVQTEGATLKPTSGSTEYTPSHTLVTTDKLGVQELHGRQTTTQLPLNTIYTQIPLDTLPSQTTIEDFSTSHIKSQTTGIVKSPTPRTPDLSSVPSISNSPSGKPTEVTSIPTEDMEQSSSIPVTFTGISTNAVTDKPNEVERHSVVPSEKPTEELGSGDTGDLTFTTPSKSDPTVTYKQSSTWFTVVKELEASTLSSGGVATGKEVNTSDLLSATVHTTVAISPSASAKLFTSLVANRTVTEDDSEVTELQEPSTRSPDNEKKIVTGDTELSSTIPTTKKLEAETSSITDASQQEGSLETTPSTTSSPTHRIHTTLKQAVSDHTVTTRRTPSRIVSEQTDQNESILTPKSPENVTPTEGVDSPTPRTAVTDIIFDGINYITNMTMTTLGGIFTTSQPPVTSSYKLSDSNKTEVPQTSETKSTLSRILEAASTPRSQTVTTAELFIGEGSGDESTMVSGRSQQPSTVFTLLRTNRIDEHTVPSETTETRTGRIRIPSTPPPPPPYPPMMSTLQPPPVDSSTSTSSPPSSPPRGLPRTTATMSFTGASDLPVALVATTETVLERTEEQDGTSGDMDGDTIAVPSASVHLNQPGFMARIRECGQCGNEICPVCGTNGFTFQSECKLNQTACLRRKTGLQVAYQGECINGFLELVKGDISCQDFECPITYNPVCGSDNRTYTNSCELQKATICLEGGASIEKISDGVCKTNT
ncbi:mucin-17 isoform X2 [Strongylocentrotus purpuratus]|uniref:Kazal-like domain-containing protein n=1 Tax=Strongylocentrotus purpuratus TaxID=7668 RepID=A0A7M7N068_STRPU|nr:mucin-17 isoform X2 [Strongylocentrotus purpuratus]